MSLKHSLSLLVQIRWLTFSVSALISHIRVSPRTPAPRSARFDPSRCLLFFRLERPRKEKNITRRRSWFPTRLGFPGHRHAGSDRRRHGHGRDGDAEGKRRHGAHFSLFSPLNFSLCLSILICLSILRICGSDLLRRPRGRRCRRRTRRVALLRGGTAPLIQLQYDGGTLSDLGLDRLIVFVNENSTPSSLDCHAGGGTPAPQHGSDPPLAVLCRAPAIRYPRTPRRWMLLVRHRLLGIVALHLVPDPMEPQPPLRRGQPGREYASTRSTRLRVRIPPTGNHHSIIL